MSRWFRLYDDTINDPKVIKLPEVMRWHWIALLCVASKNDGTLPTLDDVAIQLRVTAAKATEIIASLVKFGLLDKTETGFAPHNWSGRQYKGDGSTSRVQKYREKRRAAGLPVLGDYSAFRPHLEARDGPNCVYCGCDGPLVVDHMEPIAAGGNDDLDNLVLACKACNSGKSGRTPEGANMRLNVASAKKALSRYRDKRASVTVTETLCSVSVSDSVSISLSKKEESSEFGFDAFWRTWPNKVGKPAALKAYRSAIKRGAGFNAIMNGVEIYIRDKPPDRPWLNPATFLNQNRWEDRPAPVSTIAKPLTEFQRKQQETNDVLSELRNSRNGNRGGGALDRILPDYHRERSEGLRGGTGQALLELPRASNRGGH